MSTFQSAHHDRVWVTVCMSLPMVKGVRREQKVAGHVAGHGTGCTVLCLIGSRLRPLAHCAPCLLCFCRVPLLTHVTTFCLCVDVCAHRIAALEKQLRLTKGYEPAGPLTDEVHTLTHHCTCTRHCTLVHPSVCVCVCVCVSASIFLSFVVVVPYAVRTT